MDSPPMDDIEEMVLRRFSAGFMAETTSTATVSRKAKRLNEGHNTLRRQTRFRALGYLLGGGSGSGSVGAQQQPSHPIISSPLVKHTFQHQNQSVASFDTASYSIISPPSIYEPSSSFDTTMSDDRFPTTTNAVGGESRHAGGAFHRRLLAKFLAGISNAATKDKGKVMDYEYVGEGFPLDGEEGELIDDEGCFVEAKQDPVGIDIISKLPFELAIHVFIHLDLQSVIACLSVSRRWRGFAQDSLVWREIFVRQPGWKVNATSAARQLRMARRQRTPSSSPSLPSITSLRSIPTIPSIPSALSCSSRRFSMSRSDAQYRLSLVPSCITEEEDYPLPPPDAVAPLCLDWQDLYKRRLELDRRWLKGEPIRSHLCGHTDSVYCLEFDNNKIITGSRDRTIKIWSLHTKELLGTYSSHNGSVLCLKFDETGFMISGSSDKTICVWQLTPKGDGAVVNKVLHGHEGGVLDLRMDKKWIVSCSKDAVIRIWDRKTLLPYCDLRGHEGPVNAVGLQGDKVISASGDGKMMLWDLLTRTRLRTFEGHDRGLACIDFKGDYIISGSNDRKIKIWSASTGECLRTLSGHELLVRALSFDVDSGKLVSASYDKTVKVWDWRTGKCLREFKGNHTSQIFDVKFDASKIVSSSHDQKVIVLDFGADMDTSLFS
ncbi:hypothetical protein FRC03_011088 [Tulasnella sp. 419]|nr:hypothetical protein FRC02_000737 [Tulasnella sp. 418]KAG8955763.1 hypothetical protein FRC03_011088 [Tulasnella sp. 419]